MSTDTEPTPALPYATPSASNGSPTVAGVWIMIGGLVLICFGGCFCIGVLMVIFNGMTFGASAAPWERTLLMWVCYLLAAVCLVTGGYVMCLGLRKLLSVGR
jgi:hypothetical protein